MTQSATPSKTTTDRIVQKVKVEGFRSFIEWADLDDGHINPVFIAAFAHPTLGNVEAFCKLYQLKGYHRGLAACRTFCG